MWSRSPVFAFVDHFVEQCQQLCIERGVAHGMAIVHVSGPAWLVHDHLAGLRAADPDLSIDDLDASMLRGVIVAIDGEPVRGMGDLILYLTGARVGQQVELTVFRDGIEQNASI